MLVCGMAVAIGYRVAAACTHTHIVLRLPVVFQVTGRRVVHSFDIVICRPAARACLPDVGGLAGLSDN